MGKEALARIKIDKLLNEAGWRFEDSDEGRANIKLEDRVTLKSVDVNELGKDFEKTANGFMDYLLLGEDGNPLIIIEAKKSSINPLEAQSQAKKYAKGKSVNYVILSNGDVSYFWDIKKDTKKTISSFPKCGSIINFKKNQETFDKRKNDLLKYGYDDYIIAESQDSNFPKDNREEYCNDKKLLKLRYYQRKALDELMKSIKKGNDKFLFEMATGTGKTLVAASIIKLFLKSGFANKILFLVDRIDLENQAVSDFEEYFAGDGNIKIGKYKEDRSDWKKNDILVSTIQSIVKNDRYKKHFSEWDFGLIITDEAHRSISGATNRELFKYFDAFKLGLTATPKSFLRNIDQVKLKLNKPLELEERRERDTYSIFGCEKGPTFTYDLKKGVEDKILSKPKMIDSRTIITTELLSKEGLEFTTVDETGAEIKETFFMRKFEKRFFSEKTNIELCKNFLEHAARDPITNKIGKSIFFCVSQSHAFKIKEILNELVKGTEDFCEDNVFAERITSDEPDGNLNSKKFAHKQNNLNGKSSYPDSSFRYESSNTRVCTTVSMMSTGYNCKDLLNIVMLRPIYSPSEFIQIKGRGTRLWDFVLRDESGDEIEEFKKEKESFYLFDYFGVCEYFDKQYDFEKPEKLIIPSKGEGGERVNLPDTSIDETDKVISIFKKDIGAEGFIVDQKGFLGSMSKDDEAKKIIRLYESDEEGAEEEVEKVFGKLNFSKERFRKIFNIRRVPVIGDFYDTLKNGKPKTDKEYIDRVFEEFYIDVSFKPELKSQIQNFFEMYCFDREFRDNIDSGNISKVSMEMIQALNKIGEYKGPIVDYILEKGLNID